MADTGAVGRDGGGRPRARARRGGRRRSACLAFGPYFARVVAGCVVTLGAVLAGVASSRSPGRCGAGPRGSWRPVGLVGLFLLRAARGCAPWPPSPARHRARTCSPAGTGCSPSPCPPTRDREVLALPVAAGVRRLPTSVGAAGAADVRRRHALPARARRPAPRAGRHGRAAASRRLPRHRRRARVPRRPGARARRTARPGGGREPGGRRRARTRRGAGQGRRVGRGRGPAARPRWAGCCSACPASRSSSRSPPSARCCCRSPTAPTGPTRATPTRPTCRSPPASPRWSSSSRSWSGRRPRCTA